MNPGDTLGPYRILGRLGEGGMGAVYSAFDTRLNRTVALKALLDRPVADPASPDAGSEAERRRRFAQEARAVSALNHPHICALYDIGSQDGTDYLVMEYLEGQTLAERLTKGPLPLAQTLDIAIQMAEALTVAHRAGIVHRDLKPSNVMLVKVAGGGPSAKLLDFGLARLTEADPIDTPTVTQTAVGVLAGTVPYMAPEQVEGRPADPRTDLFAFGAVLYEMLTGARAFDGASSASVVAAILDRDPPSITSVLPQTPPALTRVLGRCLAKDPDARWQSAADLAEALRWVREGDARASTAAAPRARRRLRLAFALIAGITLVAVGATLRGFLRPASTMHVSGMSVDLTPAAIGPFEPSYTPGGGRTAITWTNAGRTLVLAGTRGDSSGLFARDLGKSGARLLEGSANGRLPTVTPDGQWVAFWAEGKIRRMPAGGGAILDLASDIACPSSMAWDDVGNLFLGRSEDDRIWKIDPGRNLKPVTTHADGELVHALPHPLPGGRVLLFTARKGGVLWGDEKVVALRLGSGERKPVLADAADARYVASGHLIFMRRGTMMVVAFDPDRLSSQGEPQVILDSVAQALTGGNSYETTGAGQYAIAPDGALAYVSSSPVEYPNRSLVRVDRHGQITHLPGDPQPWWQVVRVSPDNRRLIVASRSSTKWVVWIYDLERSTPMPISTTSRSGWFSWWSKDGQRFVYEAGGELMWATADGSSRPQLLARGAFWPSSSTDDGRLALVRVAASGRDEVVLMTVEDGRHARITGLLDEAEAPRGPQFSPDGRWLAYSSNKSGKWQVYVRPFPGPGREELVSVDGGQSPAWNPKGGELFFSSLGDQDRRFYMMAAEVRPGRPPGRPTRLFEYDPEKLSVTGNPSRCYDVAPDGQSFYAVHGRLPFPGPVTHVNYIPGFVDQLKAKVPAR